MSVPRSPDARIFYRAAYVKREEAAVLLDTGYTTGAVYLAGYGIECMLKALILASVPVARVSEIMGSFRGSRAHDFEWLRFVYFENGGQRFPSNITRRFTLVNDWSTDLRYLPRFIRDVEAVAFLGAADDIVRWADGRI